MQEIVLRNMYIILQLLKNWTEKCRGRNRARRLWATSALPDEHGVHFNHNNTSLSLRTFIVLTEKRPSIFSNASLWKKAGDITLNNLSLAAIIMRLANKIRYTIFEPLCACDTF